MADSFTTLLRLVLQETGGNQNQWGFIQNASLIDLLEDAIAARLDLDVTPATDPVVLTAMNGADDQSRNAIIALTGAPGGTRNIIVPSTSKLYIVSNETADEMTIKTVANAGVVVRPLTRVAMVVDPVADDVFSIGDVPLATEDAAGILEIATQVETDAGADDDKIITPLKLANATSLLQATESQKGALEIADQAEVDLGADNDRAVTPKGLDGRDATESLTGILALANQAEVDAGTVDDKAVTPATLAGLPSVARVIFTGHVPSTGIGEVVPAGWSVLRTGVGLYTVTHNLGLSDVDDLIITLTGHGEPPTIGSITQQFILCTVIQRTTNDFGVTVGYPDMGSLGGADHEDRDWDFICVDNS